jgi:dynein heavy chain 1
MEVRLSFALLIYIINTSNQVFAPSNSSTAAAVTFITFVQDLKKKTKAWGPMIELCANGEKTLERFRYQFPEDWLYSDQLRGEWSAYNEILKRKNDSIQEQLGMDSSVAFCHV